jgi:IS605 OrfB family transposase
LGVDLGIVNIATDSDGQQYSGSEVLNTRKRRRRQRKRLQKKGTKSAKRVAKKLSGKERRFAAQENHRISKQIVKKAKDTNRAIALENLKGIRQRVRLRKPQRVNLHSWSFHQLGQFILYKAILAGVPVVFVDPRNTSRMCSECGCVDKRSRKSQDKFSCTSCGYTLHADHNAAKNISVLGWGGLSSVRTAQVSTS